MELFFAQVKDKIVRLSQEESKHCIKVLRHRKEDVIFIIDGLGSMYEAKIISPDSKATLLEIIKEHKNFGLVPYDLTISLPPLKNNSRYEWFIEKATEIGITEVLPVLTKYTEKTKLRYERLEKILISSIKQSLRARLPLLSEPVEFKTILKLDKEQKFIALCDSSDALIDIYQKGKSTIILIGPEGGFSKEERKMAIEHGFRPVKIGNSRLRAETAAIVSAAIISSLNIH